MGMKCAFLYENSMTLTPITLLSSYSKHSKDFQLQHNHGNTEHCLALNSDEKTLFERVAHFFCIAEEEKIREKR